MDKSEKAIRALCYTLALVVTIGLFMAEDVLSSDFSPETHFYQVNYLKPVEGLGDLRTIDIIFGQNVGATEADRFLRTEIQRAVELFPPSKNLMAYAWIQTTPDPVSEKMITLKGGSKFLIYLSDTKVIMTEKEYTEATMPPADKGGAINVQVEISLEKNTAGKVRIIGTTNLPDGTKLMLGLSNKPTGYNAQDKTAVKGGRFESAWFSSRGNPIPPGVYDVSVSTPLASLQPESVKTVIGEKGQNLSGKHIRTTLGSKVVDVDVQRTVK